MTKPILSRRSSIVAGLVWLSALSIIPSSQYSVINVDELNKIKEDKILVVGKVLGEGNINKKLGIAALAFSESAKEKLEKAGCDLKTIKVAIEKNPKMEGVKLI